MVGYFCNIHTTVASMDIHLQVDYYCRLQGSQLEKIGDYFSLLIACINLLALPLLANRDGTSRSIPSLFLHVLQFKNVLSFSNRVLLSSLNG